MVTWRDRVTLERASPTDLPVLLEMDRQLNRINGWRGGIGSGFSDEQLVALLWSTSVHDQQVIRLVRTSRAVGYATLYDVDLVSQVGWIALASHPQFMRTGLGMLGGALFVHHCFAEWPLRKLLMQATDETLRQFGSIVTSGLACEVGRFEGRQVSSDGDRCDVVWLQIDRVDWDEFARRRVLKHLRST